jgi:hypothetical protein
MRMSMPSASAIDRHFRNAGQSGREFRLPNLTYFFPPKDVHRISGNVEREAPPPTAPAFPDRDEYGRIAASAYLRVANGHEVADTGLPQFLYMPFCNMPGIFR